MTLHTYAPDGVIFTFGPVILGGFAPGTFISVEQNEDSFSLTVGVHDACRAKGTNESARVTATLLQSSGTNDLLSAIHTVDINSPSGDGINPLQLKDNSGRTIINAEKAWIVKPPNTTYAIEVENREWIFETDKMKHIIGGN